MVIKKGAAGMDDLAAFQEKLSIQFNDPSLLKQALVHSSYINEHPGSASVSNERLEFLGDAVLGMIIAEKLFKDLPDASEGELTKLRSHLVCRDTLSDIAGAIGLGTHIYMGKGEEANNGRNKPTNLAGTLEAVIAAVFLDRGTAAAGDFILSLFNAELQRLSSHGIAADYKSQLQELLQAGKQETPLYHITEASGPDHARKFTAEVRVGDTALGSGTGKSKKLAEAEAARSALEQLSTDFT